MRLSVAEMERCIGCQSCMFACTRRAGEIGLENSCIHVRSIGGMERGFSVITCRACATPPCAKVCPTNALKKRKGGGVILIPESCIGCGNCRDVCLIGAVQLVESTGKPSICIHCGYLREVLSARSFETY